MRKSIIVCGILIAAVLGVGTSLIAIANSNAEEPTSSGKVNYRKEASESSLSYGTSRDENTPEGKMRKQLRDEYNAIYAEVYDSLNDSDYEMYPEDFRASHKVSDAEQETKNRFYKKVHEVVEKYSGYKVDSTDQRREAINELIEACCGTINDLNVELTLEDRTRLVMYLEEMHSLLTRSDFQQTDRDKEDIALIENTIIV